MLSRKPVIQGDVELCERGASGARLIAVASLFGITQVRVCQKNTTEDSFKEQFEVAYSYGPGGSEAYGDAVSISFTTAADLARRVEEDRHYDQLHKRAPAKQRATRIRSVQTRFSWARIHGTARYYTFEGEA